MRNSNPDASGTHASVTADSARAAAVRMLARREHGASELCGKLVRRGCDARLAQAVVGDLAESGALSDARFVEAFVHARRARGVGPLRILRELSIRGVPEDAIQNGLDPRDDAWTTLARDVRARRFGAGRPAGFPARARQMRFLQQRGFSADQIARAFDTPSE